MQKNLRVCLVSEEFPEETNYWGIWTYHNTLSRLLVDKWIDVTVICKTFWKKREFFENNVKIIRIRPFFIYSNFLTELIWYRLSVLCEILQQQMKQKFDIIESPEWKWELFFYILFFKKLFKTKIIIRLHTPLFICQEINWLPKNFLNKITNKIEYYTINNWDFISSCSAWLLSRIGLKRELKNNSQVIYNPSNIYNFNFAHKIDNIYNISRNWEKLNILFAWSHELRKWIDILLKTFNKLFDQYTNINLFLVWKYWNSGNANIKLSKEEILSYIKKEHHEKINILWAIAYKKMKNIYNFMDICVFPSRYDNFPWVVLEALLMKKSVIWSNNTWITEILKDWEDILFFTPPDEDDLYNKVVSLIENADLRKQIALNWYNKVLKENHKSINNQINLYISLCQYLQK